MICIKQYCTGVLILLFAAGSVHAQTTAKANWEQLEKALSNTQLKEFYYKKGSLYNEAEGISMEYEIPSALFFSRVDSADKNKVFILSIQPLEHFKNDGIIEESQSYMYKSKQCYYRETDYIQGLYVVFENHQLSVYIGFRKKAMHDQRFIEDILDQLQVENILEAGFKHQ